MRQVAWVPDGVTGKTTHRIGVWTDTPSETSGELLPKAQLLVINEDDGGGY